MSTGEAALQSNESIISRAKLNLGAVIFPLVLLLIGAALFFLNLGETFDQFRVLGLLLLIVGAWGTVVSLSRRISTELTLTDDRVLGKYGLLRSHTVDSTLNKIDRVEVKRSFLGRILGYGTVILSLSGAGRGREEFPQIANAEQMAQQIRDEAITRRQTLR